MVILLDMAMLRLALLLFCVTPVISEGYMRVCYYSNGAQYRPVPARMTPRKIDPNLCTHLIYAFAKLDFKNELNFTEWNDGEMVLDFNDLKRENPRLKTLLAVGGYNQGSKPFSDMAKDKNLRKKFVRTTMDFLDEYNFDGLDLNWEYPGGKGGRKKVDKKNYVALLKELRQAINNRNNGLLLSVAVPSGKKDIDKGYDIPEITNYVDFINLMSYDFHGHWEKTAGHNSPLFPSSSEKGPARKLNVNWAAKYWVKKGFPKEKLIIGLPTYGRHYTLSNKEKTGTGAPIKHAGQQGPYTKEDGFLAYYEVCELLEEGSLVRDKKQLVPHILHGDHWIGYDDEDSFLIKLEYIKEKGYGGAMVWSMDLDDFDKLCPHSTRRFPLISLMAEILGEYIPDNMPEDVEEWTDDDEWVPDNNGNEEEYTAVNEDETEETSDEDNASSGHEYKRVCYFTNWAQYRNGGAKFQVSDIDPFLCTHLIYSFSKLQNFELATFEWNDEDLYEQFNQLKSVNPDLKTLIAIGGWTAGSVDYSNLVSDIEYIQHFAITSAAFLRDRGFDGLDLDWEYPAKRGGEPEDRKNFITWIEVLREEYNKVEPRLLLTAAVAAGKSTIDVAYNIPEMAKHLDFINLMTYDLHGGWDDFVGHNSPLYARSDESGADKQLNVDWAARYWEQKGTPKEKLIIGLPTYGRNVKLVNRNNHEFGDAIDGPGSEGPLTASAGFLAYYEICKKLANGLVREWNEEHKVPYTVDGDEWIGYDDKESFMWKLDYIKQNGYGGAMVWALDLDDFNGQLCPTSGGETYPLMNLIKMELGDYSASSEYSSAGDGESTDSSDETSHDDSEDSEPGDNTAGSEYGNGESTGGGGWTSGGSSSGSTTGDSESGPGNMPDNTVESEADMSSNDDSDSDSNVVPFFDSTVACLDKPSGYYSHPLDCAKFYICSHGATFVQSCSAGTYWDGRICNWKSSVNCEARQRTRSMGSEDKSISLERAIDKLLHLLKVKKPNPTTAHDPEDKHQKHSGKTNKDSLEEIPDMAGRDNPYLEREQMPHPDKPKVNLRNKLPEHLDKTDTKAKESMEPKKDNTYSEKIMPHASKPKVKWLDFDDDMTESESEDGYIIPLH